MSGHPSVSTWKTCRHSCAVKDATHWKNEMTCVKFGTEGPCPHEFGPTRTYLALRCLLGYISVVLMCARATPPTTLKSPGVDHSFTLFPANTCPEVLVLRVRVLLLGWFKSDMHLLVDLIGRSFLLRSHLLINESRLSGACREKPNIQ